jgi:1,4-dihydroxy-2-naphthoyl-CoA hydrolase
MRLAYSYFKNFSHTHNNVNFPQYKKLLDGGLNKALGIELIEVGDKFIKMKMKINELHMGGQTLRAHGGSITTLTDTCMGFGAYVNLPKDATSFAVVDINSKFLYPGKLNDELICTAKQDHSGKRVQVWNADVFSLPNNKLISKANSTVLNLYDQTDLKDKQSNPEKDISKLGLNFNIDKMTKEEIAQRFDKHAPQWDKLTKISKYVPVFKWLDSKLKPLTNKNLNVLDLGCGIGLIGNQLRKNGITGKMYGVDISQKMLSRAFDSENYTGVFCSDLDSNFNSIFNEKFDIITCFGVTELLSDASGFIKNASKLLKNTGQFWVTFQYDDGIFNPTGYQGLKGYSKLQCEKFFKENGLEIMDEYLEPQAYLMNNPIKSKELPIPFLIYSLKLK